MNEAALLRALADNIDELDSLKVFPADITDPGSLTVAWTASSGPARDAHLHARR